jgi:hypothetical protein
MISALASCALIGKEIVSTATKSGTKSEAHDISKKLKFARNESRVTPHACDTQLQRQKWNDHICTAKQRA